MGVVFERRVDNRIISSSNPWDIWSDWHEGRERWLFVAAHDDDIVFGAGLWLLAGRHIGAAIHMVFASDGRMGYCQAEHRSEIVALRRRETVESLRCLGIPKDNLTEFAFPDGDLMRHIGRRWAKSGDPTAIAGATGLQNSFTWLLRKVAPTAVFVLNRADMHPDHQATHSAMVMSLFHAGGRIWPELGTPLEKFPRLYEYSTYSRFVQPPNLRVRVDESVSQKRLAACLAYQSQEQAAVIIERLREVDDEEYLLEMRFDLLRPGEYRAAFEVGRDCPQV